MASMPARRHPARPARHQSTPQSKSQNELSLDSAQTPTNVAQPNCRWVVSEAGTYCVSEDGCLIVGGIG